MRRTPTLLLVAILPTLLVAAAGEAPGLQEPEADLVLTGGRIGTLETPDGSRGARHSRQQTARLALEHGYQRARSSACRP